METEKHPLAPDAFHEALEAEDLRAKLHEAATAAVKYGSVDRGWANKWLIRLGAQPLAGYSEYRINTPITGVFGKTVKAKTRAEAIDVFNHHVSRVIAAGQITDGQCDSVYQLTVPDSEPTFFSGPEDPPGPNQETPSLEATKDGIRKMLMEGVVNHGWGYSYASAAVTNMGLEPLPKLVVRNVNVPVAGSARMSVRVFEGATVEDLNAAAHALVDRAGHVSIEPDEVGPIEVQGAPAERESMGLTLVDDDEPY